MVLWRFTSARYLHNCFCSVSADFLEELRIAGDVQLLHC